MSGIERKRINRNNEKSLKEWISYAANKCWILFYCHRLYVRLNAISHFVSQPKFDGNKTIIWKFWTQTAMADSETTVTQRHQSNRNFLPLFSSTNSNDINLFFNLLLENQFSRNNRRSSDSISHNAHTHTTANDGTTTTLVVELIYH